jgi:hypothetical protein
MGQRMALSAPAARGAATVHAVTGQPPSAAAANCRTNRRPLRARRRRRAIAADARTVPGRSVALSQPGMTTTPSTLETTVMRIASATLPLALWISEMPTPSCSRGWSAGARTWHGRGRSPWVGRGPPENDSTAYVRGAQLPCVALPRPSLPAASAAWPAWELTVVGIMQKRDRPVAYSAGVKGSCRTAKDSSGVTPRMERNPKAVPAALRRVSAVLSSSVRSVRPEMKNWGGRAERVVERAAGFGLGQHPPATDGRACSCRPAASCAGHRHSWHSCARGANHEPSPEAPRCGAWLHRRVGYPPRCRC